jgi:hypothetical protein
MTITTREKCLLPLAAVIGLLLLPTVVTAQTPNRADLDRDGIPNITDPDIDNDGIPNGKDRNIDGGTARSGPLRGKYIGDSLPNNNPAELDMDADGLADNAANENDIDGDGMTDSDGKGELDIDGDGVSNGLDGDVDGDGWPNNMDADMYGDGAINDIFIGAGAEEAYARDDTVTPIIAYVSGELRRIFQIPASDNGLRVRVQATQFGDLVTGVWRYLSPDNIQVYAKWAYPAENPKDLIVSVNYEYNGPYSGNMKDYTNPSFYDISEENRVYAQYPRGPITFVSWLPMEPAGFYYTEPNEQATGFAPPYEALRTALSALPNFSSNQQYLSFSGDLATTPGLSTLQPLINLQRTIMQVDRTWYGRLEARVLR